MKRMVLIYANSEVEHICSKDAFEPDLDALRRRGVVRIELKFEYVTAGHNSVSVATILL